MQKISIHALREEGDWSAERSRHRLWNFYPRPPRGGRRQLQRVNIPPNDFYPRPPRGGRRVAGFFFCHSDNFYPRPPRGGRLALQGGDLIVGQISIHALREEGDPPVVAVIMSASYFYPRPPRGGRLCANR